MSKEEKDCYSRLTIPWSRLVNCLSVEAKSATACQLANGNAFLRGKCHFPTIWSNFIQPESGETVRPREACATQNGVPQGRRH